MVEKPYDKFLILETKSWQKANYFNFKDDDNSQS